MCLPESCRHDAPMIILAMRCDPQRMLPAQLSAELHIIVACTVQSSLTASVRCRGLAGVNGVAQGLQGRSGLCWLLSSNL